MESILLEKLVEVVSLSKADFTVLTAMKRQVQVVLIKDGLIQANSSIKACGISARVFLDGGWGFSCLSSFKKRDIRNALRRAEKVARNCIIEKPKHRRKLSEISSIHETWLPSMKIDPAEMKVEELARTTKNVVSIARKEYNVESLTINFTVVDDLKLLASSVDSIITLREPRLLCIILITIKNGPRRVLCQDQIGHTGGAEIFNEKNILNCVSVLSKKGIQIAGKSFPPTGEYEAILGGSLVGAITHETIGHAAEADFLNSSCFSKEMGHRLTHVPLTIVDDPSCPSGIGSVRFDDEGVSVRKVVIVKEGVFCNLLHNLDTAAAFNCEPTGNARSWSFEYEPIVRMRNTYVKPSDQSLDELIESVNHGFLIENPSGHGYADSSGYFAIGTTIAEEIRHGKLTGRFFRGPVLSGNALEFFRHIDGIGKDFCLHPSICTREQRAFVGVGGPPIKTRVMLSGAI